MDTPLMKKVESIVNYTKSLEHRLHELHESHEFVCQMKTDFKFPTMEYIRLTIDNVKINDILHCKSGGKTIFCKVTKINNTVINVDDLEMKLVDNRIKFYKINKMNTLHKGNLGYTRKLYIINMNEIE